jgi:hypothetical protein
MISTADACEFTVWLEKLGCYDGQANSSDCEKIAKKINSILKKNNGTRK